MEYLQPIHQTTHLPDEISQFANARLAQSYSVSPLITDLTSQIDSTNLAYRFLILSGPSGVGKSSIISLLRTRNTSLSWKLIRRVTTRDRRSLESSDELAFITETAFQHLEERGELLYSESYGGDLHQYGLAIRDVRSAIETADANTVLVVVGTHALTYLLPRSCYVYLLPPSLSELERRVTASRKPNPRSVIAYDAQEIATVLSAYESNFVGLRDGSLICNEKGLETDCVSRLEKLVRSGHGLMEIPSSLLLESSSLLVPGISYEMPRATRVLR